MQNIFIKIIKGGEKSNDVTKGIMWIKKLMNLLVYINS